MQIGLPGMTFVGMASALGVSHMALYKHVPSLEELKRFVAAEIFARWHMPAPGDAPSLRDYLLAFTHSLRALAKAHPGLAPYLTRRSTATPAMTARIEEHHAQVARVFGIARAKARQTLVMVAFHCIAVADTVYATPDAPHASCEENSADSAEIEAEFETGMRALIAGALLQIESETG